VVELSRARCPDLVRPSCLSPWFLSSPPDLARLSLFSYFIFWPLTFHCDFRVGKAESFSLRLRGTVDSCRAAPVPVRSIKQRFFLLGPRARSFSRVIFAADSCAAPASLGLVRSPCSECFSVRAVAHLSAGKSRQGAPVCDLVFPLVALARGPFFWLDSSLSRFLPLRAERPVPVFDFVSAPPEPELQWVFCYRRSFMLLKF
jgi:hypothetical protein